MGKTMIKCKKCGEMIDVSKIFNDLVNDWIKGIKKENEKICRKLKIQVNHLWDKEKKEV